MNPDGRGLGTHEALGLPECGWISLADIPCPTCGMTTAFAHAAQGNLLASFFAQPFGMVLALGTAMALWIGSYVAVTGSAVGEQFSRLWTSRTGWLIGALAVAAWIYKLLSYKGLL